MQSAGRVAINTLKRNGSFEALLNTSLESTPALLSPNTFSLLKNDILRPGSPNAVPPPVLPPKGSVWPLIDESSSRHFFQNCVAESLNKNMYIHSACNTRINDSSNFGSKSSSLQDTPQHRNYSSAITPPISIQHQGIPVQKDLWYCPSVKDTIPLSETIKPQPVINKKDEDIPLKEEVNKKTASALFLKQKNGNVIAPSELGLKNEGFGAIHGATNPEYCSTLQKTQSGLFDQNFESPCDGQGKNITMKNFLKSTEALTLVDNDPMKQAVEDDDETDDEEIQIVHNYNRKQFLTAQGLIREKAISDAEEKVMWKVKAHLCSEETLPKQLPLIEPEEIDKYSHSEMDVDNNTFSDMDACYRRFIDSWVVFNPVSPKSCRDPRKSFTKGHRRVRSNPW